MMKMVYRARRLAKTRIARSLSSRLDRTRLITPLIDRQGGQTWHTDRVGRELEEQLAEALGSSQRLGFLGDRPIGEVIEHARHFVTALDDVTGTVIDLGAGGGVPGLIVAVDRPDLNITMIDRRTKRTDFLSRMVRRLRLGDRVEVLPMDVELAIQRGHGTFDAAIARGFGPPEVTLSFASQLVRPGGKIVISEPPEEPGVSDRWGDELLDRVDVIRGEPRPHMVCFERRRAGTTS